MYYTLLYTEINVENGGHNVIEYQQLKRFIMQVEAFSLCKLRHFHYASCGYFIVQVEDLSIKKWCFIPQNETPLT